MDVAQVTQGLHDLRAIERFGFDAVDNSQIGAVLRKCRDREQEKDCEVSH
jgi:hypothetical protein